MLGSRWISQIRSPVRFAGDQSQSTQQRTENLRFGDLPDDETMAAANRVQSGAAITSSADVTSASTTRVPSLAQISNEHESMVVESSAVSPQIEKSKTIPAMVVEEEERPNIIEKG